MRKTIIRFNKLDKELKDSTWAQKIRNIIDHICKPGLVDTFITKVEHSEIQELYAYQTRIRRMGSINTLRTDPELAFKYPIPEFKGYQKLIALIKTYDKKFPHEINSQYIDYLETQK